MARIALILISCFLLWRCATVSVPTGGPEDTQAPRLIASSFPNGSPNFEGRAITLTFDEYISLKNPGQEIITSPPLGQNIRFTARKNKVFITLAEDLEENTTYHINFGQSIVDVNESNPMPSLQYVFATGDAIDSMRLTGSVIALNNVPLEKNTLVGLYRDMRDSAFLQEPPFYFSYVDKDGRFALEYLKPGSYQVYALKDANNNYYYDLPNEAIGFLDSAILVGTAHTPVQLQLFQPEEDHPRIKTFSTAAKYFKVEYTLASALPPKSNVKVQFIQGDTVRIAPIRIDESRTGITAWIDTIFQNSGSVRSVLSLNEVVLDTLEHTLPANLKSSQPEFSLERKKWAVTDTLFLNAGNPMMQGDGFCALIDSIKQDTVLAKAIFQSDFQGVVIPELSLQMNVVYTLLIRSGALSNIYGVENRSYREKLEIIPEEDLGTIIFKLQDWDTSGTHLLRLKNANGKQVRSSRLDPGMSNWTVPHLEPGSYKLEIIIDENGNGVWNSGSFIPRKFPEQIVSWPKEFVVRPNWELDETIKRESNE